MDVSCWIETLGTDIVKVTAFDIPGGDEKPCSVSIKQNKVFLIANGIEYEIFNSARAHKQKGE